MAYNQIEGRATDDAGRWVDGLAVAGIVCIGVGVWAQLGWPVALIVLGVVLLGLALVGATRGAA